jgi:hypothetical protein
MSMSVTLTDANARPSWDEVIHLAGELDDATVESILSSGATYSQVEQAVVWASGKDDRRDRPEKPLTGAAAAVYDILITHPQFIEAR